MSQVKLLRWLSTETLIIPGLKLTPVRYGKRAIGGPYRAELRGEGDELAMWNGMSALGAGVEIYSDLGDRVWWGQLYEATLTIGVVTIHVSLDDIKNRIKIAYTTIDPTTGDKSGRIETDWEYDSDSIMRYGLSEMVYSVDGASETEALYLRRNLLLALKDPKPAIDSVSGTAGGAPTLTFHCRGWWETLDRRYFFRKYSEYGYKDTGVGEMWLGLPSPDTGKVAQSFQVTDAMSLKYVFIGIGKGENPTDNVCVKIHSDTTGSPGTLLGTSENIAGTSLTDSYIWTRFTFTTTISLSASTTYWIVVERTGSLDAVNWYKVDTNQACGYSSGAFKIYVSSWASVSPDTDMNFAVSDADITADIDSTALMEIIIEEYGAVVDVNTAEVIDTSGIDVSPSRDGSKTALAEITELLEKGSTNYRRMLARVLENRRVEIYEEPASTASGWIDREGRLYSMYGSPIRDETCPVAMWIGLRGVVPLGAAFGNISTNTCFWIEECEYDVGTKKLTITPRQGSGSNNFLVVGNG
jgi:hypothetical protein